MAITVTWGTSVINVPQSDLTFVSGNEYVLNADVFRAALKSEEASVDGIHFPDTHNHTTQTVLGGITYARFIEILSPYTVTFEDVGSPYSVTINGANTNIQDVANLNDVSIRTNNSAGLVVVNQSGLTETESIIMDRIDILYKTFLNRAVTVENGDGSKTITFYDDDQLTPIDSVHVTADGLIRTNV